MEIAFLRRARACCLLALFGGGGLALSWPSAATAADASTSRRGLAAETVREALQREAYGLTEDRERLLKEASDQDPRLETAKWHTGQVQDDQGKWVDHEQFSTTAAVKKRLADYERVRDTYPDTAEGQLALAQWCAKKKLLSQQRAHLSRVLDLESDHPEARERLGFVRVQGSWVSREELAGDQVRQQQTAQDLVKWRPVLQEILVDLRHRSADRKSKANERLLAILDPSALPAMSELVLNSPDAEALLVLEAQAQMTGPEASEAIAREAVLASSAVVRDAAAEKLTEREFETFVPQLLGSLYSPVTSRMAASILPNGRIGYRHAFVREGADKREMLVLDTEYERVSVFGGDQRETASRASSDAASTALERNQAVRQQNRMTKSLNERIMGVLTKATREQFTEPADWWKWWNEHNEVFTAGDKAVAVVRQGQTISVADQPPPQTYQSTLPQPSGNPGQRRTIRVTRGGSAMAALLSNPRGRSDCLAAGTIVWTASGQTAIEAVRVGDLVLARDADTGELAYKPVLRTTVRPRGPLVRIQVDNHDLQTSGGHPFWVSGEGWVKARELEPGMVLHGAEGPARVQAIDEGETAETYNLVVADFSTYFVGPAKVLSHDNTVRQSTRAIVPGLQIE